MSAKVLVEWCGFFELLILAATLSVMAHRRVLSSFPSLTALAATRFVSGAAIIAVIFFYKNLGLHPSTAYNTYLLVYWPGLVLQSILMICVVYSIYNVALAPFEPLRKLGTIIFRWVSAISAAVAVGVAVGPHMWGGAYLLGLVSEIQKVTCVGTLCLLIFVCIALRPLGLTFRSQAFGASLGLGVMATVMLLQSAWMPSNKGLFSSMNFYSGLGFCAAMMIWGVYFALPERKRQMVLLPTTSPYFFWNRISEALGDAPGYVAISGFTPESLAPGELDALVVAGERRPEPMRPVMQPVAVNSRLA